MATSPITLEALRRYAVARTFFAPVSLPAAMERLGFVQADPIRAPARAQDLTLRHRVKNYVAGDLEKRYAALGVEEDFFVNYGFLPRACRAYRPETKGKVERPFRYIREDFFLGSTFRDLDDLNLQFGNWLGGVANPRVHASTGRVVNEAFAEERPTLHQLATSGASA